MKRTMVGRAWRSALVLAVAVGVAGGGTVMAWRAHADEGTGSDCLTGWRAEGFSTAVGQALDLPYESLVGEPWASAAVDDTPLSEARGSLYYEGPIGQVVVGTAAKEAPENPFEARAHYPAPGGAAGESQATHDFGPLQHSRAQTEPGKAIADVRAAGVAVGDGSGVGAIAHADAQYTGDAIHGTNSSSAYDVNLGGVHIAQMTSLLQWKSDGTDSGSAATFTFQFHGVTANGQRVSSSNGDGFTFSNQAPSPGPAAHKQFADQVRQFNDALQKAGVGNFQLVLDEGTMQVSAGEILVDEVGFKADGAPGPLKTGAVEGASWQFGRTHEEVTTSRGPCEAVKELPPPEKSPSASTGPTVPLPPGGGYATATAAAPAPAQAHPVPAAASGPTRWASTGSALSEVPPHERPSPASILGDLQPRLLPAVPWDPRPGPLGG